MVLEGVVTNVAAFGAFVDVGVHQDGLVHISQLSDRFVKDPHSVVKAGEKLKVRVLEVDAARKRISLTARLGEAAPKQSGADSGARGGQARRDGQEARREQGQPGGHGGGQQGGPQGRPGGGGRQGGADAGRRESGPRQGGGREIQSGGGEFGHNPFARLLKK